MTEIKFLENIEYFLDNFFDTKKIDYNIFLVDDTATLAVFFHANVYMIQIDKCFDFTPRDLAVLLYKQFLNTTFKEIYGNCKFINNLIL